MTDSLRMANAYLWKVYKFCKNIIDIKFLDFEKFKYLLFGSLNVGCGWVLYFLIYNFLVKKSNVYIGDLLTVSPHVFALMLSFSFTFFCGFFTNYYLVFPRADNDNSVRVKLMKYLLANIGSVIINYILLKVFVERLGWYPTPSQILSTIAVTAYSFIAQQKFTFAPLRSMRH